MRFPRFGRRRWLVHRGMAAAKVRRAPKKNPARDAVESHSATRVLIFIATWAALLILIHPGRHGGPIDLQPGQRAPESIYSETDFEFVDQEATERQREFEREQVPPVFTVDLSRIETSTRKVSRLMTRIAERKPEDGSEPRPEDFEDLAANWTGPRELALRPTDLARIAQVAGQTNLEQQLLLILSEQMQKGIALPQSREMAAGMASRTQILVFTPDPEKPDGGTYERRAPLTLDTPESILPRLRDQVATVLRRQELPEELAQPLARLLAAAMEPNLLFDRKRTDEIRDQRAREVQPVVRSYHRGETLLERGHLITPGDLLLLKAHQTRLGQERTAGELLREWLRTAAVVGMLLGLEFILLLTCRPELRTRNSRLLLVSLLLFGTVGLWQMTWWMASPGLNLIPDHAVFFAAPTAAGPILGTILLGAPVGVHLTVVAALIIGVVAAKSVMTVTIIFITAGTAVYAVRKVRLRSQLVRAGLVTGGAGILCTAVFALVVTAPDFGNWLQEAALALAAGILGAFLAGSLLPFFEFAFKIPTDISLLELSDTNHPLLRRMQEEAPGTYHHSLMVANLAEAASEAIGANPLLARVCALYHDIGKMVKPDYYTENIPGAANPHDGLAEGLSRVVIQAHVKEGVDLAMKYRLTPPVVEVIRQHHGTSLVKYFYHKARQKEAEEKGREERNGNGASRVPATEVREETFRYPGPKPTFRESAIILLADAIEAASRSMKDPTPAKLEGMVRDIVREKILDGQLDDSDLTLKDLRLVQDRFVATLKNMLHSRIEYPNEDDESRNPKRAEPDAGAGNGRAAAAGNGRPRAS